MHPETIKIIQRIAKKIAPKFTFGYYDTEDIEQECFLFAYEGLKNYKEEFGSLESFLYTHLTNRLKNLLRNNYLRQDFTCRYCDGIDPHCKHCLSRKWKFEQKKHIMEPIDLENIGGQVEENTYIQPNFYTDLLHKEIFSIINDNLELHLRHDFLKMKEGSYVPKQRREYILRKIRNILIDEGYIDNE